LLKDDTAPDAARTSEDFLAFLNLSNCEEKCELKINRYVQTWVGQRVQQK
jgi:hypothetical protein